jgi:hypothetical protein
VNIIESKDSTLGGNPAYILVEGYEPIPEKGMGDRVKSAGNMDN